MRMLDTRQMREVDRRTIEEWHVSAAVLMENAGHAVADAIGSVFGDVAGKVVVVLAGRGNNGGDGFVVSRVLTRRGAVVLTLLVGRREEVGGEARETLDRLADHEILVNEIVTDTDWASVERDVLAADLVVDAIVGTGFQPPLRGVAATVASTLATARVPVVAIDLPSGLSADSAEVVGPVIRAAFSVALGAPKLALVQRPAADFAGRLVVADIGIPKSVIEAVDGPRLYAVTRDDARSYLPARSPDSHKGHYGHVVIVAGSPGKTGAAVLAARGALRSGAGLVTIATAASLVPLVAAHDPEVMTLALPESSEGTVALAAVETLARAAGDVFVVGPGLGLGRDAEGLVRGVIALGRLTVLDADALNALAASPGGLVKGAGKVVITPHPAEMARLVARSTADVQAHRISVAAACSREHGVYVVLKGHRTVLATPSGDVALNLTGNAGMATAGAGDVLAGVIGAWLGQLSAPAEACRLGVYLHGLAGDLAARESGQPALIASDIVAKLGAATLAVSGPVEEGRHW